MRNAPVFDNVVPAKAGTRRRSVNDTTEQHGNG